jgi:CheY-like chemotaxis protein
MGEPNGQPVLSPAHKTILVVEDDVLIRFMIADDLMANGFNVIQAATADEALTVLYSAVSFDLVLTDIRMPGSLDGLAFAARIRAEQPHLKVVILSGDIPATPHVASLADAFLSKPYSPSAVLICVKQLLSSENEEI